MNTSTAGNGPKMESSKSPKLMPANCSRLRRYELFKEFSTCFAGAMIGVLLIASITSELPPAGKLTPKSILPDGFSPSTALRKWVQSYT